MDEIRSLDIMPTREHLKDCLEKDSIHRNKDIFSFISLLERIRGHYILALDGQWGSGKTFFVKQCGLLLSNHKLFNKISKNSRVKKLPFPDFNCIYYDAWENDDEDDPIASLMYQIVQQINILPDIKVSTLLPLVLEATNFFFGKNPQKMIDALTEMIKGSKDINTVSAENNAKLKNTIGQFLDKISKDKKVIIFIDELDRCNPAYAVKLLERIKHYFNHDRIIFVFSTNIVELSKTVKEYYGTDFNGERYLDRFFDSKIILPAVDRTRYWYPDQVGLKDLNDPNYYFYLTCKRVIEYFDFSLREIDHFKTNAKEILKVDLVNTNNRLSKLIKFNFAPILLGLKMSDLNRYNEFISGNDVDEYKVIMGPIHDEWLRELHLLKDNEDYEKTWEATESVSKLVDPEKHIVELYQKIFSDNYSRLPKVRVGTLEIPNDTRETIIRIINLFNIENE